MERLRRAFENRYRSTRVAVESDRSGLLGLSGITFGTTLLSPMTHAAYPLELRPFLQVHGYSPLDIIVAHLRCGGGGKQFPALYVNARLPPIHLTWNQVGRILTRGNKGGDLTVWDQIGVRGEWTHRAIHVYGPPDDGGFVSALRHASFGGNPLTYRYEALANPRQVAAAVQGDIYGIGLIERWDGAPMREPLRLVSTSASLAPGGNPDQENKARDPFAEDLHFYMDAAATSNADTPTRSNRNATLDSFVRFVLSPAGQRAMTQQQSIFGCRLQMLTPSEVSRGLSLLH